MLDVGASKLIIEGKIKLKNDSQISHFSKNSIVFENGSEIPADVVIFATGYVFLWASLTFNPQAMSLATVIQSSSLRNLAERSSQMPRIQSGA